MEADAGPLLKAEPIAAVMDLGGVGWKEGRRG